LLNIASNISQLIFELTLTAIIVMNY